MLTLIPYLITASATFISSKNAEIENFGVPPPKPENKAHTLTCDTQNKSTNTSFVDGFGKLQTIKYASSTEIDYFKPGWIDRIPKTVDVFDFKNLERYISYVVIDVRNVNNEPRYHYFTNGRSLKLLENWSTTKTLAVVSAIQRIRLRTNLAVGANSIVNGSNGRKSTFSAINNLIHLHSDNAAAVTMKQIAHPNNAENFANNWILPPVRETFSSGYGATASIPAPYRINDLENPSDSVVLDSMATHNSNSLSPMLLAESMKRIGVNRRDEILMPRFFNYSTGTITSQEQASKLAPAIKDEDLEILFYGSKNSDAEWTGMTNEGFGLSGYLLPALGGKENADAKTSGRWRVFSKTGTGTSATRGVTEGSYLAHVCLPEFDGGREFTMYFHITDIEGTGETTQTSRAKAAKQMIETLIPGFN